MTIHIIKDIGDWWFILPTICYDHSRPSLGVYWLLWGLEIRG